MIILYRILKVVKPIYILDSRFLYTSYCIKINFNNKRLIHAVDYDDGDQQRRLDHKNKLLCKQNNLNFLKNEY